jgi:selenocysteine lyase/cysteine desulfurase
MDWNAFRNQFPALEGTAYLNTAGGGALSQEAAEAGMAYYTEHLNEGDAAWSRWLARVESVRGQTGRVFGAAAEDVSFLQNASLGLNVVARSFPAGTGIVVLDNEFPSCTTPFMAAGHALHRIPTPPGGTITAEDLDRHLTSDHGLFVVSSVQYATGFRADLPSLAAVCRSKGVGFVVDATQSVGAFPVRLDTDGVDYLVFSGYKWATAGYGIAVLMTATDAPGRDVLPPLTGWRSARQAYDLENDRMDFWPTGIGHEMGHPLFPGIFTFGAALDLLARSGIPDIGQRILSLSGYLVDALRNEGYRIRSCTSTRERSGIVLVDVQDPHALASRLSARNVFVSPRGGGLRVSVHAYNTEDDIDRLVDGLRAG